jgi:hypothetical protein
VAMRVVIAGGGVAALEAALALRASPRIASASSCWRETQFWYRPLAVTDFAVESGRIAAASSADPGQTAPYKVDANEPASGRYAAAGSPTLLIERPGAASGRPRSSRRRTRLALVLMGRLWDDGERPHHVVVLMLDDVTVMDVALWWADVSG